MESIPSDARKRKEEKDREYQEAYIRYIEKRIDTIGNENQKLYQEQRKLELQVNTLINEVNQLKQTPMITGTITDLLDEHNDRVIVASSTGPSFVVHTSNEVKCQKINPSMNVGLNLHNFAVMEVIPASKDPFIKAMELFPPRTIFLDARAIIKSTSTPPTIEPLSGSYHPSTHTSHTYGGINSL